MVYTVLLGLISAFLYDLRLTLVATTLGKNLRPPVPEWSNGQ